MNYLQEYCTIFDATTKWDRVERLQLIEAWSKNKNPVFPTFQDFLSTLENRTDIYFGDIFHHSLTFPFCNQEIQSENLEAVRLLYDYNLDKQFMLFLNSDSPLYTLGLSIDSKDTQMLYEKFLFLTQLLESSISSNDGKVYYRGNPASKSDMEILFEYQKEYPVICDTLRKTSMRISQLTSRLKEIYPIYYDSLK